MATDPDLSAVVREALEAADSVDARTIDVQSDDQAVVLRGGVATAEEATAAVAVAEQHAGVVRNELRVDVNLREGLDGDQPAQRTAPTDDRAGSPFDPTTEPDDLVDDLQESLEENVAWDPPHQAVEVPTRAEERGVTGGNGGQDVDDAPTEDSTAKSLSDLSPEELSRAAHPQPREEETA